MAINVQHASNSITEFAQRYENFHIYLNIARLYFSFLTSFKHLTLDRDKQTCLCSHIIGVFIFHFLLSSNLMKII